MILYKFIRFWIDFIIQLLCEVVDSIQKLSFALIEMAKSFLRTLITTTAALTLAFVITLAYSKRSCLWFGVVAPLRLLSLQGIGHSFVQVIFLNHSLLQVYIVLLQHVQLNCRMLRGNLHLRLNLCSIHHMWISHLFILTCNFLSR